MNVLFFVMWLLAGALWAYALVPLTRLKRHLARQKSEGRTLPGSTNISQIRAILRDKQHPLHRDARRMMVAYGGFLFCWIVGFGLSMLPTGAH